MTFNGLTERAMAARILRMHDVEPEPELMVRFLANLERSLLARAEATKARGHALIGARAALEALARPHAARPAQSVLTGNIRTRRGDEASGLRPAFLDRLHASARTATTRSNAMP